MNRLTLAAAAVVAVSGLEFDYQQALISHNLSLTTYCTYLQYLSHDFTGSVAEGFVVTYPIHNNWNDLQGFVGYLPSDNSIWVAFRGTESWDNYWKIDFDDIFMKYDEFPECNCYVHTGF